MNKTTNEVSFGTMRFSRRKFSVLMAAAGSGLLAAGAWAKSATLPGAADEKEVSHSSETIHQTLLFNATPKRVYEALTDEKQFDKVVKASAAMQSGMKLGDKPTQIAREAGGTFALFGGHIIGRHLELLPGERIVQAWRVATWEPGVFSIALFALAADGAGTKLIFDHTGFPNGLGEHLLAGWNGNYWEPLKKVLG